MMRLTILGLLFLCIFVYLPNAKNSITANREMLLFLDEQKSVINLVTAYRDLCLVILPPRVSCTFEIQGTLELLNFQSKVTQLLLSL